MPRGRGGARTGTPGKAYQNRTDLHGANVVSAQPVQPGAKLPVATASGQPYGAATVQRNAQQTVGMAGTQTPPPPAVQAGAPTPSAPLQAPTPLNAPTDHGLPVTTGVDAGPGAGSEVLLKPVNNFQMTALGLLESLGDNVSPQVAMIRNSLRAGANNGLMQ